MSNLRDALAAEYLFNGNANDTSGHDNHGQMIGATPTTDRFGTANGALCFDGKDDYVIVVDPPRMSDQTLTISAWVRFAEAGFKKDVCNALVSQDDGKVYWKVGEPDQRRIFRLMCWGRQVMWHRLTWWGDGLKAKLPLVPDEWYHLAVVVEHKAHHIYIDGRLDVSKESWFASHPGEPLYIGRMAPPDRQHFFKGAIDDVRIYNRALSVDEIAELYYENGWTHPPHVRHVGTPEPFEWQGEAWTSLDIDALVAGATHAEGGRLTVAAGGTDIHGKADSFRYAYRQASGDFTATVRLDGVPTNHDWTKSGIMVRRSLDVDAPNVLVLAAYDHVPRAQFRANVGDLTTGVGPTMQQPFAPVHLKLSRRGDRVTFFTSPDGVVWTQIEHAVEVDLGDGDVYVGLAVCSHAFGLLGEASFADWRLDPA